MCQVGSQSRVLSCIVQRAPGAKHPSLLGGSERRRETDPSAARAPSGQRMTEGGVAAATNNRSLHAGRATQCSDQRDVSCTVVRQPPRPFVMLSLSEASPHAGCIQTQERSFGCGLRMTRCGEAVSCTVVRQPPPLVVIPSRSEESPLAGYSRTQGDPSAARAPSPRGHPGRG